MSHWLQTLMNEGVYGGKGIVPPAVLKATLEPAIALPNTEGETRGYWEMLNAAYGMGRETVSYRGHWLTFHGGAIGGFFSQVSFMPQEHVGVIVLVIGQHCSSLVNTISYNSYERLLGLSETPWSERRLEAYHKNKAAATQARAKAGADRVPDTHPSHLLAAYAGKYENPAYGVVDISLQNDQLRFQFHKISLPLTHFHYDRFDTPDDELDGKWSLNFSASPQGELDRLMMSLDEAEAVFTRQPEMLAPGELAQLAGAYLGPSGARFTVALRQGGNLWIEAPGDPGQELLPYKGRKFRTREFADLVYEFVVENGRVQALKETDPAGEYISKRAD